MGVHNWQDGPQLLSCLTAALSQYGSEVEPNLSRQRTRRDIVRAAES
jgi:hypothetical protein